MKTCTDKCVAGRGEKYYYEPDEEYCYDCDGGGPFWNGTQCVACPPERPNWDDYLMECVELCPIDTPVYEYMKDSKNVC